MKVFEPKDCERIRRVLASHGLTVSPEQAQDAWLLVSDRADVAWMALPEKDDNVFRELRPFVYPFLAVGDDVKGRTLARLVLKSPVLVHMPCTFGGTLGDLARSMLGRNKE